MFPKDWKIASNYAEHLAWVSEEQCTLHVDDGCFTSVLPGCFIYHCAALLFNVLLVCLFWIWICTLAVKTPHVSLREAVWVALANCKIWFSCPACYVDYGPVSTEKQPLWLQGRGYVETDRNTLQAPPERPSPVKLISKLGDNQVSLMLCFAAPCAFATGYEMHHFSASFFFLPAVFVSAVSLETRRAV